MEILGVLLFQPINDSGFENMKLPNSKTQNMEEKRKQLILLR